MAIRENPGHYVLFSGSLDWAYRNREPLAWYSLAIAGGIFLAVYVVDPAWRAIEAYKRGQSSVASHINRETKGPQIVRSDNYEQAKQAPAPRTNINTRQQALPETARSGNLEEALLAYERHLSRQEPEQPRPVKRTTKIAEPENGQTASVLLMPRLPATVMARDIPIQLPHGRVITVIVRTGSVWITTQRGERQFFSSRPSMDPWGAISSSELAFVQGAPEGLIRVIEGQWGE